MTPLKRIQISFTDEDGNVIKDSLSLWPQKDQKSSFADKVKDFTGIEVTVTPSQDSDQISVSSGKSKRDVRDNPLKHKR